MKKGIEKVDGAQEGKFLIASEKAEIDAIPLLDIASKEVASTHKLSISHIRDVDLFYAQTRGIPEHAARELAIEGFFGSLLTELKQDEIMEQVRTRIHKLTKK
jgi:Fe-S cluster assembly protein SufD